MQPRAGRRGLAAVETLHAAYDEQAAQTPEALAVICRPCPVGEQLRSSLTYAALRERSQALAVGLARRLHPWPESQGTGRQSVVAVQLPRTHADFVALVVAVSRIGLPFVLLSTDLPDRTLEAQRSALALRLLQPCLYVAHAKAEVPAAVAECGDCQVVAVEDLVSNPCDAPISVSATAAEKQCSKGSDILCFLFTGGTQRTKIVEATHAMVLHERGAYQELWRPRTSTGAVVLAHTSVYWGASALGQLSIALAFGGTAVCTDAAEIAELRRCIAEEKVTVLGVVPDHLDLLAPQTPAVDLPSVEAVFTWGERLPRRVADRWRSHPHARLFELLIATEYWLSLWADPLGDGQLRPVTGTDVLVLTEGGGDAGHGELGELCIAGPMVMAGYRSSVQGMVAPDPFFLAPGGRRFFRTSDLVRRTQDGLVYKGRADMMAKDKGKWVDMIAVEDAICQMQGIGSAKVLPDPVQEHFHAFVQIDDRLAPGPPLDGVRAALPPRVRLWPVPELPRHPVTRKVDAARLLKMLGVAPPSWPVERGEPDPLLRTRLTEKGGRHAAWTLGVLGVAWTVSDGEDLATQLVLALAAGAGASFILSRVGRDGGDQPCAAVMAVAAWLVLAGIASWPFGWLRLARWLLSVFQLGYGWLALTYADDARNRCSIARATMLVIDELPLWKLGAFISLSVLQHLSGFVGMLSKLTLHGAAVFGAVIAARRHRLLAWMLVFWVVGAGHQIDRDCTRWLCLRAWTESLKWQALRLKGAMYRLSGLGRLGWKTSTSATTLAGVDGVSAASTLAPDPVLCKNCGASLADTRWPAHDDARHVVCDACGRDMVANYESRASAWLLSHADSFPEHSSTANHLSDVADKSNGHQNGNHVSYMEPIAKRQKTEKGHSGDGMGSEIDTAPDVDITDPSERNGADVASQSGVWQPSDHEVQRIGLWWWYRHTTDIITLTREELERSAALCAPESRNAGVAAPAQRADLSVEARMVCAVVGDVEPLLKPVHMGTFLLGLDSLRIARLSNAIRARLGRELTAPQLREVKTVAELVAMVESTRKQQSEPAGAAPRRAADAEGEREFAVWYSPGQFTPMGHWVLRSDARFDRQALLTAAQRLVDRHAALRVKAADPLRYMSFLFDAAVLFSVAAPLLDEGTLPARCLRRLASWAFSHAWPRVRCQSREAMYAARFPGDAVPLEVVRIDGGQRTFEHELKRRRSDLVPPGAVTGYELFCYLEDVWDYQRWPGRFAVVRRPRGFAATAGGIAAEDVELLYVDLSSAEWGPLIGPRSAGWQRPPYGFPALFCAPLSSGAVAWLRLEGADELRVCYRAGAAAEEPTHHLVAYRAAPQRPRDVHEPVVVSFLGICMLHAWSDGNSYLPLVQDFFSFYEAAQGHPTLSPQPLENAFAELERRLLDTFTCRPSPLRASLRGSIWQHCGRGFGHTLGFQPGTMAAIVRACSCYRVPLDVALFGLVACAMARADGSDVLEFTLYAPMRDGVADSMSVGLFADWRDLCISADIELATTLGTVLQIGHKIQYRQWSVFNALRKPERVVVNIQPLDFERRAGFVNLGENMWHGGDQLGKEEQRGNELVWVHQPASFVIEQQDEDTWWILASSAEPRRPVPWMRAFIHAFHDSVASFLFDPLARVHRPLPEDSALLCGYREEAASAGFI